MKKTKVLLTMLVSAIAVCSLSACGGGGGSSSNTKSPFRKLTGPFDNDDVRPISFSAVYASEVQNSVCLPKLPETHQFNDWADREAVKAPLQDRRFVTDRDASGESAIELVSQNKNLGAALSALVFESKNLSSTSGSMRSLLGKSVYSMIPQNCQSIACIGEAAFGQTYGARLYFQQKFGFLISEHVDERLLSPFRGQERLESVLYAVGTLPKNILPFADGELHPNFAGLSKSITLSAFKQGRALQGSPAESAALTSLHTVSTGTDVYYADVNIYLYDRWQEAPDFFDRVYIVFHEFIHMYDKGQTLSGNAQWTRLSGWEKTGGVWKMKDESKACSIYGLTSPAEDFAECGALYRFAPARLAAISPEKYNYFKTKVFKGVEFIATSACENEVTEFTGI